MNKKFDKEMLFSVATLLKYTSRECYKCGFNEDCDYICKRSGNKFTLCQIVHRMFVRVTEGE